MSADYLLYTDGIRLCCKENQSTKIDKKTPRNYGGNILRKWLNQETHSGIMYGMTAANPEMVMCTNVISCPNPDTDRPVGWHSTLVPASYTHH